jgi:hypothetical protein
VRSEHQFGTLIDIPRNPQPALRAWRELFGLTSLKPVRRPRYQPVLPQGLTPLRPLITQHAEVGVE